MDNKLFNPRSWGIGSKFASLTFALIAVVFILFSIAMAMSVYSLMQNGNVADVQRQLVTVNDMFDIFERTTSSDANRISKVFKSAFQPTFSIDQSQKVDVGGKQVPLLKNGDTVINLNYSIVDKFTENSGALATVFLKTGDDFLRISTSLKKENGDRAVGTVLDHTHPAYPVLMKGDAFTGFAKLFGKNFMTSYNPVKDDKGNVIAVLFIGIDITDNLQHLKESVKAIKIGQTGYFFALDMKPGPTAGTLMIHPSKEGTNIIESKDASGREFIKEMLEKKHGVIEYPWLNKELGETSPRNKVAVYSESKSMNWLLAGGAYTDEIARDSTTMLVKFGLAGIVILLSIAVLLYYTVQRMIVTPLVQVIQSAETVAGGDLRDTLDNTREDEIGNLIVAMNGIGHELSSVIKEVRSGTSTIAIAAQEIASGNADLSSRTESQASTLEQTASSMEEITGTVKQNADNAQKANQMVIAASAVAEKGSAMVGQVVQTMNSIKESSHKIVDIIGVIDGIAFQTNILALNAAVEAARAGEQGRGFAVVASEVRNLAQRSATASKEIKSLIDDSVNRIDRGSQLVDDAGKTMHEIVDSVKQVSEIMNDITVASREQSSGIEQINLAIAQMDEMTQQNSALVEEAAAAAESMHEQSKNLTAVVEVFKV